MGTRAPVIARAAAVAYAAVGAYATRVAIEDEEAARFGGRSYPGPTSLQFLWAGTALSAPVYILAGYARAGMTGNRRALAVLAATTIAGQLGEPLTWRTSTARQRAIVAANLMLPATILLSIRQARRAESNL